MTNSAFLPFVFRIWFSDRILWNPRKIKGSFDNFQSKWNRIPKVDNFFKLTQCKRSEIRLFKHSRKYSKFLGQHHILSYLFTNTLFKFGSICSLFMVNDSQKSWTICLISFSFKKIWKIKALLEQIVVIYWPMHKQIFPIENE